MSKENEVLRVVIPEGGPVAVIEMTDNETYRVFWDGGFWGDGDGWKAFNTLPRAMRAIAEEVLTMINTYPG